MHSPPGRSESRTVRAHRLAFAATSLLALLACRADRAEVEAPVAVPEAFTAGGELALPERWWLAFDDPELAALVDRALEGNLGLAVAWDRLAQAEAVARKEGAPQHVQLDYAAGASIDRVRRGLSNGATQDTRADDYSLGLTASYEVDLWGRIESRARAAELEALASAEDVKAAAITLIADLALTWYRLVEQNGQRELLERQRETNQQVLDVVTLRFRRGQVGAADVLRQRQLVESIQGEVDRVEANAAIYAHQLAILTGRPPAEVVAPQVVELTPLAPLPDTGLPSELIQRRPDVRAAYLDVEAADERVAVALADRWPRLTLSARASTSASSVGDLFDFWLVGLAADLVGPILDGDERDAEIDRTRAVLSERLHAYGQTILGSLAEVEDALALEREQRDLIASLERQLALSDQVIERIRDSYTKGAADYLRVLEALATNQSLQRNLLTARRQLVEYRIDLCRALAGGWELQRPELARIDGDPVDTTSDP